MSSPFVKAFLIVRLIRGFISLSQIACKPIFCHKPLVIFLFLSISITNLNISLLFCLMIWLFYLFMFLMPFCRHSGNLKFICKSYKLYKRILYCILCITFWNTTKKLKSVSGLWNKVDVEELSILAFTLFCRVCFWLKELLINLTREFVAFR